MPGHPSPFEAMSGIVFVSATDTGIVLVIAANAPVFFFLCLSLAACNNYGSNFYILGFVGCSPCGTLQASENSGHSSRMCKISCIYST